MFNIGIIELLIVIFFIALFVKPEEIPKISKNLGLLYRKISRYYYNSVSYTHLRAHET